MKKIPLGFVSGPALGPLEGFSAFFMPAAAGMMTTIIIASAVEGLVGSLAAGLIALRASSVWATALWSGVVGTVLS